MRAIDTSLAKTVHHAWRWLRHPSRRWLWFIAGTALFFFVKGLSLPGIGRQAQAALAVFAEAAFLWGSNSLPLAVTGVLVLWLLPASGALSTRDVYSYFGSDALFFILGALVLASPVMRSGLSSRIALAAVRKFGSNPHRLVLTLLLTTAFMAFFISEHAVVAMIFPIVLELLKMYGARPGDRLGTVLFLASAWGGVIGGTATLLGGARAPLALGVLEAATGQRIGFFTWLIATLPIVIVLLLAAYIILGRALSSIPELERQFHEASASVGAIGPVTKREIKTTLLMLGVIAGWIWGSDSWGLGAVALAGVVAAFVIGVADWNEVEEDVNWGVFLMYGSAIALAAALHSTGAADYIARVLFNHITSPASALGIIIFLSQTLTESMSNAAAVAVLMPVALASAGAYGLAAELITLAVSVSAGLAFLLPVSTPAIAIVVGSGYVKPAQAFGYGLRLKLLGMALVFAAGLVYWPRIWPGG
ncbi:SLC13 family permease [Oceanithermus sp.]